MAATRTHGTELLLASRKGDVAAVTALLAAGADVEAVDEASVRWSWRWWGGGGGT